MNSPFPATLPDLPDGVTIPCALAEPDGLAVLAALAHRYGWTYAIWRREAITEVLDGLDMSVPPRQSTHQGRRLTDEEWRRVADSNTWRRTIPDVAYDRVSAEDLLEQAAIEAGLACAECRTALTDPPGVTGRLCEAHRTGPAGQPTVVNPATEGLYWLDGDTLTYAPIYWERKQPWKEAGAPVEWDELDPLARYQARRAETALRAAAGAGHDRRPTHGTHPASR